MTKHERFTSLPMIGVYFAIPGVAIALSAGQESGTLFWKWVPIPVGLGTFITAIIVWVILRNRTASIGGCVAAGTLTGVLSHPVSAVVTCILVTFVQVLGIVPQAFTRSEDGVVSVSRFLGLVSFLTFWWCLIALLRYLWLTMAVGALIGFIIGLVNRDEAQDME